MVLQGNGARQRKAKGRVRGEVANARTPTGRVNWSEILKKGGVPEPPGYQETLAALKKRGPRKPKAQRKKAKPKRKG